MRRDAGDGEEEVDRTQFAQRGGGGPDARGIGQVDTGVAGAWNTSDMGRFISDFRDKYGQTDSVWIVPFPYWVDTRLPGVWAGIPNRDFALWPEQFADTLNVPAPKMFIFRYDDLETENALKELYPDGVLTRYTSPLEGKDFMIFMVER